MQYGLPLAETVPLLAALLSLPLPADYAPLSVSPEQQKQQTLHALLTILLRMPCSSLCSSSWKTCTGSIRPRWRFLSLLVDQGPTARILALFTFRRTSARPGRACPSHPGHGRRFAPTTGGGGGPPGGAQ